jgi:hypothetical protein
MQRYDACKTRAENKEEHEATSANESAGRARAYRILKQRAIGRPLKKSQWIISVNMDAMLQMLGTLERALR